MTESGEEKMVVATKHLREGLDSRYIWKVEQDFLTDWT